MTAQAPSYRATRYTCYLSTAGHAIINNLAPLLFVTFQRDFGVSLQQLGALVSLNFGIQLLMDATAARFVRRWGVRHCMLAAEAFCVAAMLGLAIFPRLMPPYIGLLTAVVLGGIGGGLNEVLLSPIVDSLPGQEKAAAMSMLHSFYCWGHVAVVALSTLFFVTVGRAAWPVLCALWGLVPLCAALMFLRAPLAPIPGDEARAPVRTLFRKGVFWLLFVLMMAAGAAELSMAQWASLFAETGLGVSKTVGDLLGPCAFAVMMGLVRVFYGVWGSRVPLRPALLASSVLCVGCYLLAALARPPLLALLGCALCGLSVGLLWPGTLSLAAQRMPQSGTILFAMLALGGDIGCTVGPGLVALIASAAQTQNAGLRSGLLFGIVFPLLLVAGVYYLGRFISPTPKSPPAA